MNFLKLDKPNKLDIDEILQIEKGSFQDSWNKQFFEDELIKQNNLNFVLKNSEKILAYLFYQIIFCSEKIEESKEVEILRIAVDKNYRQNGFAFFILQESFKVLLSQNIKIIFLEVSSINCPAMRLYNKLGFKIIGLRKNYYKINLKTPEDALILKKEL